MERTVPARQTRRPDQERTVLLPAFLKLSGRLVVVVGGGRVALTKLPALIDAGARLTVVAPVIRPEIERLPVSLLRREFTAVDLNGVWYAVAAATPVVNRAVSAAATTRRVFVNVVDDPREATAFAGSVVRRGGVTLAISTNGAAPALTRLLREALDELLPRDIERWLKMARRQRTIWRRRAVPLALRRPLLLDTLNQLYRTGSTTPPVSGDGPMTGFVSLVGAGPGHPELLTRKAVRRLRQADLVLYDALVSADVLRIASRAQRFCVGKRAHRHSVRQDVIQRLMIRHARLGKRVVRLKGGDPFVFGRGGEEALALSRAGIPYEIVPGISSALAAPALAGIPVTHRGLASAFLVLSGHDETAYRTLLHAIPPGSLTLVVLMGRDARQGIASALLERGWKRRTPAAIVAAASTTEALSWTGPLEELGRAPLPESHSETPATLVIGDVVALAAEIAPGQATRANEEDVALSL